MTEASLNELARGIVLENLAYVQYPRVNFKSELSKIKWDVNLFSIIVNFGEYNGRV